jgi:hypothetical protein
MTEVKATEKEIKEVSFRRLIEVMEKEGFRVCDIHIEEEHDSLLRERNKFTGSLVIKTFPEKYLLLSG